MNWFFSRLSEPSSYAGFAALANSIPQLIASKGTDTQALVTALAGFTAFAAPEKKAQ